MVSEGEVVEIQRENLDFIIMVTDGVSVSLSNATIGKTVWNTIDSLKRSSESLEGIV